MPDTLVNLLSASRRKALSRAYLLRLGAVGMLFAAALAVIAAALLAPTYLLLTEIAQVRGEHLAQMTSTISSTTDATLPARLTELSQEVVALTALAHQPAASTLIREALGLPRTGITLSSFSYMPIANKKPGTFYISGNALTRSALNAYLRMVQEASFASLATLPVSVYAGDADISFTITVTLAP